MRENWREWPCGRVSWLLAAAGMTVLTLWFPVVVSTDPEHLGSVRLGRPLWFAVQDQSRYAPPGEPWRAGLVSPWECPVRVVWWRFLVSWVVVAGLLWLVLRAVALLTGWQAGAAVRDPGEAACCPCGYRLCRSGGSAGAVACFGRVGGPVDVVCWRLPGGRLHCGIVSDRPGASGLPGVAREEDCLGWWEIVGHFRYPKWGGITYSVGLL